jgi:hypothetical protein
MTLDTLSLSSHIAALVIPHVIHTFPVCLILPRADFIAAKPSVHMRKMRLRRGRSFQAYRISVPGYRGEVALVPGELFHQIIVT